MAKTYLINEVARAFGVSVSTLRYYDKQGLLPFVQKNQAGYRLFTETDLNFLKTITCLKNTGMDLKTIRQYIELCMTGVSTIAARRALLEAHAEKVAQAQAELARNMAEVQRKIADYSADDATAIIKAKIDYVSQEKTAEHLANPYAGQ